jgi:hypothetical protein
VSLNKFAPGKPFVELSLQDKLGAGLDAAAAKFKAFGKGVAVAGASIAAAGGVALGAIVGLATAAASNAAELNRMSQITGASVESLSTLGYAAARSQVEVESLYAGIEKMNKFLGTAQAGSAEATQALSRLGLSVGELVGLSPDEQFRTLADALSRVSSQAERTALATAVFGRGAFDLIPLLNEGGAGIRALEQDFRDMGGEVTQADATLGRQFLRNINAVTNAFKYASLAVGRALLPALVDATGWMRDVAKIIGTVAGGVVAWIKENKALVTTVVLVAGGVVALGAAIVGVGTAIAAAGFIITGMVAAISAVGAVIGAILSPFGLIIAAVVAVGGAFAGAAAAILYYTGAARAAIDWFRGEFGETMALVVEAFGGVTDAIKAGDLGLAFRIVGLTIQAVWTKCIEVLKSKWLDFRDWFLGVWNQALDRVGLQNTLGADREVLARRRESENAASANAIMESQNALRAAIEEANQAAASARRTPGVLSSGGGGPGNIIGATTAAVERGSVKEFEILAGAAQDTANRQLAELQRQNQMRRLIERWLERRGVEVRMADL